MARRENPLDPDVALLRAIASPIRLYILRSCDGHDESASTLAAEVGKSVPHVDYHIGVLRELGLLRHVSDTPAARGSLTRRNYRSDGWVDIVRRALAHELVDPPRPDHGEAAE